MSYLLVIVTMGIGERIHNSNAFARFVVLGSISLIVYCCRITLSCKVTKKTLYVKRCLQIDLHHRHKTQEDAFRHLLASFVWVEDGIDYYADRVCSA